MLVSSWAYPSQKYEFASWDDYYEYNVKSKMFQTTHQNLFGFTSLQRYAIDPSSSLKFLHRPVWRSNNRKHGWAWLANFNNLKPGYLDDSSTSRIPKHLPLSYHFLFTARLCQRPHRAPPQEHNDLAGMVPMPWMKTLSHGYSKSEQNQSARSNYFTLKHISFNLSFLDISSVEHSY